MSRQEHLVQITLSLPPEMPADRKAKLVADELERGLQLRAEGTILRIWRLPGRPANVGIWVTSSTAELHEKITSLPLYPWMRLEVTPLAPHPVEEIAA
ncbi:muconolactone Delta-isomerase family protein [Phenylobacterium sp. LjRoot219]|uniref:muconolactone Delta-isomerase n=1 Tax=Phenylobacterium sp. LjRoot219 TaxID=3342283 RepID=UPI003ECE05A6